MNLDVEYILFGAVFLLWLDIIIVLRVLANKTQIAMDEDKRKTSFATIADFFKNETSSGSGKRKKTNKLFDLYLMLAQSIALPEEERNALHPIGGIDRVRKVLLGMIKSRFSARRKQAALGLAILKDDEARQSLEKALCVEKDYPTKLVFANALADIKDPRSIPFWPKVFWEHIAGTGQG